MNIFDEVYKQNKELDKVFINKYEKNEPYLFEKNCIEFLVELGEFINETKCFKYWTIKKPNKDLVYEEFADCITMVLTFFSLLDMNLNVDYEMHQKTDNVLLVTNYLYQQGVKIMANMNEELLKDIFVNLIYLGNLVGLENEKMVEMCLKKQETVFKRLNSDY